MSKWVLEKCLKVNRAFYEVAVRYSEYGVSDSENSQAYRPVEYGVAS